MANGKPEKDKKQAEGIPDGDESAVIGVYSARDIISCGKPSGRKIKVKRYNFKRPDKFSKDQIRTVSVMHEIFCRLATVSLSARLKTCCHIRISCVDQMTYEEFAGPCTNPAVFCVVNMDPLKGSTLFHMDNSLAQAMIQVASGGQASAGERGVTPEMDSRTLSDIDSGIIESLFLRLTGDLREAWAPVLEMRPQIGQIDDNPQMVQIVPPTEMIILVTFDCTIGEIRGKMNFCIPFLTIEPIIHKLFAQYWYSSGKRGITSAQLKKNLEWTTKLATASSVFYNTDRVSLAELAGLKKGSLIPIPGMKEGKAVFECGGREVLELIVVKSGHHDAFMVPEKTNDDLPGLETPSEQEAASAPIAQLEKKLSEALQKIETRISELSAKQTEYADQAFFEQPVAGISAEQAEGLPLQFASALDRDQLARVFSLEHPQVTALALSCMDPVPAGDVLGRLPESMRPDIAMRIAGIGSPASFATESIIHALRRLLAASHTSESKPAGGAKHLAAMLASIGRKEENELMDIIRKENKPLAE
ncbi:MAG: hypothetical protein EHM28_14160, partial [Spirochaetaceae bacterium]